MQRIGVDRLDSHFQPVVDMDSGAVVAYEALGRASRAGSAVPPDELLRDAYDDDRVAELDVALIGSALRAAQANGLVRPFSLFLNVEPVSLARGVVPAVLNNAHPLVIEITERALTAGPGALLRAASALRAAGHLIAIDDLGAEPASLALLPLLAPEIVKLDMGLIRRQPDRQAATMMTAIAAYAETSGAVVLAEGIETEQHLTRARALGATLGQGWYFGRPDAMASDAPGIDIRPPRLARHAARASGAAGAGGAAGAAAGETSTKADPWATPFDLVSASSTVRRGDRDLLVEVSNLLEDRAAAGGDSAVLLSTFQSEDNISALTRRRYERLVGTGCLLTAYSTGAPAALPHPARSVVIGDDDPLAAEWDVVLLTADYAAALTAKEIDRSRHREGLYEFVLTADRDLVVRAARALLERDALAR